MSPQQIMHDASACITMSNRINISISGLAFLIQLTTSLRVFQFSIVTRFHSSLQHVDPRHWI